MADITFHGTLPERQTDRRTVRRTGIVLPRFRPRLHPAKCFAVNVALVSGFVWMILASYF